MGTGEKGSGIAIKVPAAIRAAKSAVKVRLAMALRLVSIHPYADGNPPYPVSGPGDIYRWTSGAGSLSFGFFPDITAEAAFRFFVNHECFEANEKVETCQGGTWLKQ
jgi:hypothetical protein